MFAALEREGVLLVAKPLNFQRQNALTIVE